MSDKKEQRLRGAPASPSIAMGVALFVGQKTPERSRRISAQEVEHEATRLFQAINAVEQDLSGLQEHFVAERGATSLILEAYRLMLRDPLLLEGSSRRISQELWCAEAALRLTQQEITRSFDAIDDEYLRSRKNEVSFVIERVIAHMQEQIHSPVSLRDAIVIAQELSPVDVATYVKLGAKGFISALGGPLSHAAIVARALGLPGVVSATQIFSFVAEGDTVIIDGMRGEIIVRPTPQSANEYEAKRNRFLDSERALLQNREESAITVDGTPIVLRGNIEILEELPGLSLYGARGIGLFRTEFSFLYRNNLPDEEEQLRIARDALQQVSPEPITFRTLDLGGDKILLPGVWPSDEPISPRLRAIRLCLEHPSLFRTQLRALLRASIYGRMRLLLPMITGLAELRAAKAMIASVSQELAHKKLSLPPVPIGIMIETPSAVMMSDVLAKEADFFCIGSNDLIQYTLAIDRAEEVATAYYRPHHPAILRMLRMVIESAVKANKPVSLCGEMAADPLYSALLIGLGLRELSMSPSAIPAVKQIIRKLSLREAELLCQKVMSCDTSPEIENLLRSFMKDHIEG